MFILRCYRQDSDYYAAPASSSSLTLASPPPSVPASDPAAPTAVPTAASDHKGLSTELAKPPKDAVFEAKVVIHEALHLPLLSAAG